MGQRYTRLQELKDQDGNVNAHCAEFKFIHPGDQALFLLSVTDCGGSLTRRPHGTARRKGVR